MEIINTKLPFSGVMSSEIGGRVENQDTCGYTETPRGLLLVVCDGMGGGPAGKTASVIATSMILEYVKSDGAMPMPEVPHQDESVTSDDGGEGKDKTVTQATAKRKYSDRLLLKKAVKAANLEMCRQIALNPALAGMGTTAAVVLINEAHAVIAHVGDSRIYQIRDKKIVFRTADHSRVGEMVRAGSLTEEQARLSAYSNVITRALGIGEEVDVEVDERPYESGDRFVICTDGVWGAKPEKEMVKLFSGNPRSLEGTLDVLNLNVENAGKEKGGKHDNYTAIILETKTNSTLKEKMSKKVKIFLRILAIVCALSIIGNILFICIPRGEKRVVAEGQESQAQLDSLLTKAEGTLKVVRDSVETLKNDVKNLETELDNLNEGRAAASGNANPSVAQATTTQSTAQQTAPAPDPIKTKVEAIIAKINEIGDIEDVAKKKAKRKEVIRDLTSLQTDFSGENLEIVNECIAEINKNVTINPQNSKGQCNAIVQKLKKLL